MPFDALLLEEVAVGKPVTNTLMEKIKYNFDYLYGRTAGGSGTGFIPNSSFEIDSDEDGVPDQWTRNLYAGGSGEYETTDIPHGTRAYKFTHPGGAGNGGGYLTSDYIEASEVAAIIGFWLKVSVAGIKVRGEVLCYDKEKIALAGEDAVIGFYEDATSNPTDWQIVAGAVKALPTDTRYIKIRLHGGVDDTNVAGTVMFDNIMMFLIRPSEQENFLELVIARNNTERETGSSIYVKLKEITLGYTGTIRTSFQLGQDASKKGNAQIYINDIPVGTERESNSLLVWTTYTEDFSGCKCGDKIQLFVRAENSSNKILVRNFRIEIAPTDIKTEIQIRAGYTTVDTSV